MPTVNATIFATLILAKLLSGPIMVAVSVAIGWFCALDLRTRPPLGLGECLVLSACGVASVAIGWPMTWIAHVASGAITEATTDAVATCLRVPPQSRILLKIFVFVVVVLAWITMLPVPRLEMP
jgi:hypothetical protein